MAVMIIVIIIMCGFPLRRFGVALVVLSFPAFRFSVLAGKSEVGKRGWIHGVPARCP